jgi:hypothetical protein
MAKIVFIANVGERDLYYNVGSTDAPNFCHFELGKGDESQVAQFLNCGHGSRYIAERILQRLRQDPQEAQRLRYPILKTVLDDGVLKSGKAIDKLILVVTDQPAPPQTPEQFYCRDSVNSGQVLTELIKKDYPAQVGEIIVVPYQQNLSQALRERTYEFFGKLLSKEAPERDVSELHASLSGGVPAFNDSLQEQALRLYKAKCRFYEVIPPEEQAMRRGAEKGQLQAVSAKPFLRDLAVSIIEQLLNRYDYSGALEVLKMFQAVKFWDDEVEAILKHAERRINFNFSEAASPLQRFQNTEPMKTWYQQVQKPILLDQLIETYFIAQSRYQNREYTDMLWRVSAFYENGLRLIAAKLLKLPALESEPRLKSTVLEGSHSKLHKQMLKDPKAKRICIPKGKDKGKVCFWESNVYNFRKLCQYGLKLTQDTQAQQQWRQAYDWLCSLDRLSGLRNEMIHNLRGVSENDLHQAFDPPNEIRSRYNGQRNHEFLIPTLQEIASLLSNLVGQWQDLANPYQAINDYLREKLRS